MATRRAIITVTIEPELLKRVDDLADVQGLPRSQLIEHLITQGINDEEIGVKAMTNPVVVNALMKSFRDPTVLRALANAVGEELSPDQLNLFRQAMSAVDESLSPQQQMVTQQLVKQPAKRAAAKQDARTAKRRKQAKR